MTPTNAGDRPMRELVAGTVRRAFGAGALVASRLRLISLKLRFPGLTTVGRVFIGPGCDIYIAPGSTVRLEGCTLVRDVTLVTSPGATMTLACFRVGRGVVIVARDRIEFAAGSGIADLTVVRDSDHRAGLPLDEDHFVSAPIVVGRDVAVYAQSTLLGGITIGDGAIIAAGSVVTKDVPPGAVVGGVPARIIRHPA
jgi:acetyltransferase-like isoleucine patch superfamily enzyme